MKRTSIQKKRIPKRFVVIGLLALLLAGSAVAALEFTNTTYIFHKKPSTQAATIADSPSKGEKKGAKPSEKPKNPDNNTSGEQKDNDAPTTALIAPTGDFVSSHRVKMSSPITSVCTTTSGATCEIIFSMSGESKALAATTADRAGNVYWDWKPTDIGLTPGTWTITAKATLQGQSKTTADVLNLELSND